MLGLTEDPRNVVPMVIGPDRIADSAEGWIEVVNPANGTVIARVPSASEDQVGHAVAAAQAAFEGSWSTISATARGKLIYRFALKVADHAEELAQLESTNVGKPIRNARQEAQNVATNLEYYAGAANKIYGETIPVQTPGLDFTIREPIGVVGLIIPWNFPMLLASWKLGPALAAGNTCVLKPASYTPLTALRLAELALEAGLPPGVINVVTGPGPTVGEALVKHVGVGKIAFTGETTTGQHIMRLASENLTRVTLELGGKSPNIVFADADLADVAAQGPMASFGNTGQNCCSRTRLLVDRAIYDEFLDAFTSQTSTIRVGDPRDESTDVGPLVSLRHRERVASFVEVGTAEGLRIVMGGQPPDDPDLAGGAYFMPTILDGATSQMRVSQEEIFGPVVAVSMFDTEEDAVRLANSTQFGLAASIWTRDIGRAIRMARRVKSGDISVNINRHAHLEAPFGGYRKSGIGRELGMHAIEHYTELKNVFVAT